jgi:hypothetical protein
VQASQLRGYQVVTRDSALDASPFKQVATTCPAGQRVTGSGWEVLDPTSAILRGSARYARGSWDGGGWLTNAAKYDAVSPTWKLRVRTLCTN